MKLENLAFVTAIHVAVCNFCSRIEYRSTGRAIVTNKTLPNLEHGMGAFENFSNCPITLILC
jgi:hypothetical protein